MISICQLTWRKPKIYLESEGRVEQQKVLWELRGWRGLLGQRRVEAGVTGGCCELTLVRRDTHFSGCGEPHVWLVSNTGSHMPISEAGRATFLLWQALFFPLKQFCDLKAFCTFVPLLNKFLVVLFPSEFRIWLLMFTWTCEFHSYLIHNQRCVLRGQKKKRKVKRKITGKIKSLLLSKLGHC